jgi:hypothetical protein
VKLIVSTALLVLLTACAGSRVYTPSGPEQAAFQQRSVTKEKGLLRVTASVPDQQETLDLTGLDLYSQGIQPVWIQVQNNSDHVFWVIHKSIDPDYFSPIEVSYMNRKSFTKESQAVMERWFWQSQLERLVGPGDSIQGYVYTHLEPGTKGFNLEAIGAHNSVDMTFFIEMPGFRPDYMNVDLDHLYPGSEKQEFTPGNLVTSLNEALPCCSSSSKDKLDGLPFNLVLVATTGTLRRALFRAGWHETAMDDLSVATARKHLYLGRPPDGVFYKSREDGEERKELRLWLTPYTSDGIPVIIAQAVQDLAAGVDFFLDPDLNAARNYAIQSFWYGQSLRYIASGRAFPATDINSPKRIFTGADYFADGVREYLWLSDSPVALDELERQLVGQARTQETQEENPQ